LILGEILDNVLDKIFSDELNTFQSFENDYNYKIFIINFIINNNNIIIIKK